jgi:hypothetical protein
MHLVPRVATVAVLLTLAMGGCGGESFDSGEPIAGEAGEDNGGSAGTGAGGRSGATSGAAGSARAGSSSGRGSTAGDSGVAGTTPVAGRSGVAGASSAGAPSTGGSGGAGASAGAVSGGEGGAAGEPGDVCRLPAESGACSAAFERFYFNAERGICEPFLYGGCGSNGNNFETLEACHAACAGHGTTDPTACNFPTDCAVTARACCGGHSPPILADVTAVNTSSLEEFNAPCGLVDCASVIYPIPAHFGATCSDGHCLAFDLRTTDFTSCSDGDTCLLRSGLHCCEGCGSSLESFVAIRGGADLSPLICGDVEIGCDACVPTPPDDLSAECIDGRCTLSSALDN